MIQIKKLFSKTSDTFKSLIKKFPITLIVVAFTTIFMTIVVRQSFIDFDLVGKIYLFCVILGVETFSIEIFFDKKKIFKIIACVLGAVIAFVFSKVIYDGDFNFFKNDVVRILTGYLMILFIMSIYGIIRKNKLEFKNYLLNVFANMFNATITYLVLNIGITLITVIFIELLLDSGYGVILARIQILLLGLFYIPAIINSLWDVRDKDINTFIQGLVKYVLLPLVTVAMLIIYLYIIKILVFRQMPSNIIFRILAGIFVAAFPVWNMADNFKDENKLIGKATKLLPYFYMPFILLEVYSLYARIFEFGLTPVRYFGIIFIIAQVVALILTVVKKGEKLSQLFIYSAILILVAFITPLNYEKASILSQKNILEKSFPETKTYEELTQENKTKASGAYKYLIRNDGENYIPDYINEEKKNYGYYSPKQEREYIFFYEEAAEIDVREYSKLIEARNENMFYGVKEIKIYNKKQKYIVTANLEKYIGNVVNSSNPEDYIRQNRLVEVNDLMDLYINSLNISYNEETREVYSVMIDGYILQR